MGINANARAEELQVTIDRYAAGDGIHYESANSVIAEIVHEDADGYVATTRKLHFGNLRTGYRAIVEGETREGLEHILEATRRHRALYPVELCHTVSQKRVGGNETETQIRIDRAARHLLERLRGSRLERNGFCVRAHDEVYDAGTPLFDIGFGNATNALYGQVLSRQSEALETLSTIGRIGLSKQARQCLSHAIREMDSVEPVSPQTASSVLAHIAQAAQCERRANAPLGDCPDLESVLQIAADLERRVRRQIQQDAAHPAKLEWIDIRGFDLRKVAGVRIAFDREEAYSRLLLRGVPANEIQRALDCQESRFDLLLELLTESPHVASLD